MKFTSYIKDKIYVILLFLGTHSITLLFLFAFKVEKSLIIVLSLLNFLLIILSLTIDFFRKQKFYTHLLENINNLDKAYLVLETIEKPNFYEGKLITHALYEINKSMAETVKILETQTNDFKEYIEMWIHEVKIPIASLILMTHNHKEKFNKKMLEQMHRIDAYVEQVLYYVRSENAEHDYLIKEIELKNIINNVALKNKDELLENNIEFQVENVNFLVNTDAKWLEFILNQIINNSIKYKKENTSSYIKIEGREEKDKIYLSILDNGIGILESDIKRVFEKTYTGTNGRIKTKSTGMGLYIAKNLCMKLGHTIEIKSKEQEFTKVIIKFSKNEFYKVAK